MLGRANENNNNNNSSGNSTCFHCCVHRSYIGVVNDSIIGSLFSTRFKHSIHVIWSSAVARVCVFILVNKLDQLFKLIDVYIVIECGRIWTNTEDQDCRCTQNVISFLLIFFSNCYAIATANKYFVFFLSFSVAVSSSSIVLGGRGVEKWNGRRWRHRSYQKRTIQRSSTA